MREDRYLFVDGGHLRRNFSDSLRAWSGEVPPFVIDAVTQTFNAGKCFYYDAVDDQQLSGEDEPAFRARLEEQEDEYDRIQRAESTHVRLGSVTGIRRNRRQKQVDILLAVEMMNHAVRGNMKRAVLLSGDQDFKPLVDSLVDMGLYVEVAGDKRHTSRDLTRAADTYTPLSFRHYHSWAERSWQNRFPLPRYGTGDVSKPRYMSMRSGSIGEVPVELLRSQDDWIFYYRKPSATQYAMHTDPDVLERAFIVEFGEIAWA